MDYEAKKARFEAIRARAAKSRNEAEGYRGALIDLYRKARGKAPDLESEADREGFKALVDLVEENSDAGRGREVEIPPNLADRLIAGFGRYVSMFEVARVIIDGFPKPLSDRRYVWVSSGGQVYHRYQDCPGLAEGRAKAGKDAKAGLRRMTVESAKSSPGYMVSRRRACKICLRETSSKGGHLVGLRSCQSQERLDVVTTRTIATRCAVRVSRSGVTS